MYLSLLFTLIQGVPELADQIETVYSLMVMINEGKKRLEKYSGCNSFLVMN
jgi:hypothetical protein